MRLRRLVPLLLAAAVRAAAAGAEEAPIALSPGQSELNFSFVWQDSYWGSGITLSGRAGYFLTAHHEVGPIGSAIYSSPDTGPSYWGGSAGAFYRYNLDTYKRFVIPYAGAAAMWAFADAREASRWLMQLEAGVRLMLSPSAGINVSAVYQRDHVRWAQPDVQRTFALVAGVAVFPGPRFRRAAARP